MAKKSKKIKLSKKHKKYNKYSSSESTSDKLSNYSLDSDDDISTESLEHDLSEDNEIRYNNETEKVLTEFIIDMSLEIITLFKKIIKKIAKKKRKN